MKKTTPRVGLLMFVTLSAACSSDPHVVGVDPNGAGASGSGGSGSGGGTASTGSGPPISPVDASCATATAGPFTESLPVPAAVVATGDEHTARLQWGGPLTWQGDEDDDVEGYRVCWGPKGETPSHGALSTMRLVQLFGVKVGTPYVAYVQSVDGLGNVSASTTVEFEADPSRVAALREKMTGFFDDFNIAPGPVDELKWNTAYAHCNDPRVNGTYVVDGHAMNLIGNNSYLEGAEVGCDREQNISRARGVFDFIGREGTIAFDFEGGDGDRSTWYVDVFPYEGNPSDLIDITGHATSDPGGGHPGRFLRFSQVGNLLMIHRHEVSGAAADVHSTDIGSTFADQQIVPGVMRRWELKVAKDHAAILIDGVEVLAATVDLDFEKGIVTWDQFNYNTVKAGRPWVAFSFDNFGFDGPVTPLPVHNYKTKLYGGDTLRLGFQPDYEHDQSVTIPVPDEIAGAQKARVFFTIQNNNYEWVDTDTFSVNGQSFPIPKPVSQTTDLLVDDYRAFAGVHEVPFSHFVKGDNVLGFHAYKTVVRNLHVEFEFPAGGAPAFTQPGAILPGPLVPDVPLVGPSTIVGRIDEKVNNISNDAVSFIKNPTDVSGTITVALKIDCVKSVLAQGKNLGVSRAELMIDSVVHQTIATDAASPAPEIADLAFTVDTTTLSNGPHEVFAIAYDSAGTKGRVGYGGEWGSDPDHYAPIIINVTNN